MTNRILIWVAGRIGPISPSPSVAIPPVRRRLQRSFVPIVFQAGYFYLPENVVEFGRLGGFFMLRRKGGGSWVSPLVRKIIPREPPFRQIRGTVQRGRAEASFTPTLKASPAFHWRLPYPQLWLRPRYPRCRAPSPLPHSPLPPKHDRATGKPGNAWRLS